MTTRREIGNLLAAARIRGPDLDLHWLRASGPHSRATCITPKFGHSVVERNKLRRRLRELMRSVLVSRSAHLDYLVRVRPSAYGLSFAEIETQLRGLESRLPAQAEET